MVFAIIFTGLLLQINLTYPDDCQRRNLNLDKVPKDLDPLCENVILEHNHIKLLPEGSFVYLKNCKTLNLAFNLIENILRGAFNGLGQVTEVRLNNNKLFKLESGEFRGLHSATRIILYNNSISQITPGTFQAMPLIMDIFLEDNNIRYLPQGVFAQLSHLRRVQLHSNHLKSLSWTVFADLSTNINWHPHTLQITLYRNPEFNCRNVSLCWLKKGESEGWITWLGANYQPNCQTSIEWSEVELQCPTRSKLQSIIYIRNM